MKVLTVELPDMTYEIHMLNPHEHMEGFGGSKSGLVVGTTASLVLRQRQKSVGSVTDTEYDIYDPRVWRAIGKWINDSSGTVKATRD